MTSSARRLAHPPWSECRPRSYCHRCHLRPSRTRGSGCPVALAPVTAHLASKPLVPVCCGRVLPCWGMPSAHSPGQHRLSQCRPGPLPRSRWTHKALASLSPAWPAPSRCPCPVCTSGCRTHGPGSSPSWTEPAGRCVSIWDTVDPARSVTAPQPAFMQLVQGDRAVLPRTNGFCGHRATGTGALGSPSPEARTPQPPPWVLLGQVGGLQAG